MGGGYGRGLGYFREQQEQYGYSGSYDDKMKNLWLKDGEVARFWFVTEGDEVLVPMLHQLAIPKKNGQGTWSKDVYCGRRSMGDPLEKCDMCVAGETPGYRACLIAYVTAIYHPNEGEGWEARRTSDGVKYEEKVNDYRFLVLRSRLTEQVNAEYLGITDELGAEPGSEQKELPKTLLDRPFTLSRKGAKQGVVETLKGHDRTTPPEAIVLARKNAPDLVATCDLAFTENKRPARQAPSGNGLSNDIDETVPGRSAAPDDAVILEF